MLHLLLVIKLVTVNAISWQTCDPHHIKKTTAHAQNIVSKYDDHDRGRERKGERESSNQNVLEGKVSYIYTSGHGQQA